MRKELIYLADLTHTSQIVASNVMPLGIGLIASYLLRQQNDNVRVELFKYPEDLNEALQKEMPVLVGFANYSWNLDLAYQFARRIKEVSPSTIIVFGGPNYGLTEEEIEVFWRDYPLIDFYLVKEGEIAFSNLYQLLLENNFSVDKIKHLPTPPPQCHFKVDGKVMQGEILPRIKNLDELGSPYLEGLMDKFFDNVLLPMIHTTRGCPFTCTFCSEGNKYYSSVAQRSSLEEELSYIAARRGQIQDLVITDANFGMYNEDREKAQTLRKLQESTGWPRRIVVSTGKNQKEKIIEVAGILNGALSIAASLQSTDATVLKNISRSNISTDALNTIVQKSSQVDATTYTEIILGLPGDSCVTHTQSLRDVVNAGLGIVRMYQLILLPQTELNTPDNRRTYGMKTRFRINPRSFGKYNVLGKEIISTEHEEILVSSNTLSFEDYLNSRQLDLSVEMLHNSGMFVELQGMCRYYGLSWFDLLLRFYNGRHGYGEEIKSLYNNFSKDSQVGLWESRDELVQHVNERIEEYLSNTDGTNEMAKSKAIAFFHLLRPIHEALYQEMRTWLREKNLMTEMVDFYLKEVCAFSILRKENFIDCDQQLSRDFRFDFFTLEKSGFNMNPEEALLSEPANYEFRHNNVQKEMIQSYIGQYGSKTIDGLGRIMMRAPARRLFRCFSSKHQFQDNKNMQYSNLNVYGGFTG